ncbi:MAG TPA: histidine triad nucleotide-binding protein [Anaerolineae bacterium]|nr:histidine triad nucleotide-binding protein [Anaerolineae bacterium]HMR65630.1 histidine triad nucleotide-binding protein [Anaerolineae bacterium]
MSQNCIFCKIVAGQIGGKLLYQDDQVTAFRDINPQAPTHILLIPNKHITSTSHALEEDQAILGKLLLTAAQVAKQENVADSGYRLVINKGEHGGQTVFHLHVHLLAGRPMTWPPG